MTCNQLGGACDTQFHAETFEEMAELSKTHAMEMAKKNDAAHIKKMEEMKNLMMTTPEKAQEWFANTKKMFDELPEDAS